jgi:protein TonB
MDGRRAFGPAMSASLALHGALALLAMVFFTRQPALSAISAFVVEEIDLVYLQQPFVAELRGGGGSRARAPRVPLEIPRHERPAPVPIVPAPREPEPLPLPVLDVAIQTEQAAVIRASGTSGVSIAAFGGGGQGGGLGAGTGAGVGAGSGGGFGGGAYRPGAGVSNPVPLRQPGPRYTSDAMRAKTQGEVRLEAVVLPNGTVGDIRVVKSLDRTFGLDDEAIKAARDWLFSPGRDAAGRPVPVLVILILEFRIR